MKVSDTKFHKNTYRENEIDSFTHTDEHDEAYKYFSWILRRRLMYTWNKIWALHVYTLFKCFML